MPTLGKKLKELGYNTHLIGKWHLGQSYRNATPVAHGFDNFFGYWNGYMGYFNHEFSGGVINNNTVKELAFLLLP